MEETETLLLTQRETAKRLGMSLATLRARRARLPKDPDACPPFVRIGRTPMFPAADVDAWAKKHQAETKKNEALLAKTLPAREVCRLLKMSRSTLRAMTSELERDPSTDAAPKFVRVHGRNGPEVRFREIEVRRWIARQAKKTKAEEIDG